jgi:peptidoglycan/LPS O-acetylase OafA/YrhL
MENSIAELKARTAGSRYIELDGLRGLAAASVLGHHFLFIYDIQPRWFEIPLAAGHEAVMLFFIMSGFVLSIPYWNGKYTDGYGSYLVRRCFRIYVPYVAAVGVAVLGDLLWGHRHLPLNGWYYLTWQAKITPRLLIDQLLMSPSPELNTAFWSLRYEVQFSLVLPFILALFARFRLVTGLIGCIVISAVASILQKKGFSNTHSYLETLRYMPIFMVGVLLARDRASIHALWDKAWPLLRILFVVTAASLYWGYEHYVLSRFHLESIQRSLTVCGAVGLLIAALYVKKIRTLLRSSFCEYLGRLSYSLYLVHGTVLFALVNIFYWKISRFWLGILFVAISMALAHLFCAFIEEPSLRLGKRLAMLIGREISSTKDEQFTSIVPHNLLEGLDQSRESAQVGTAIQS